MTALAPIARSAMTASGVRGARRSRRTRSSTGWRYRDVRCRSACQNLDFECEIGVVIGRGREPRPEERRRPRRRLLPVQRLERPRRAAQRDGDAARPRQGQGHRDDPRAVARDEGRARAVARPMGYDLQMVVSVNGREYGRDRWSNAFWSIGEIIAYASRGTKVCAGDVLGRAPVATAVWPSCGRGTPPRIRGSRSAMRSSTRWSNSGASPTGSSPARR